MSWPKEHIKSEISLTPAVPCNRNANPPIPDVVEIQTTGATFEINNAKLNVPAVTLSTNNIKLLENIKHRFRRTISWSKYRSEITTKTKNNNLHDII